MERQLTQQRLELDQQRDAAVAQLRQLQETSRAQELELNSRLSRTRAQFEAAQRDKDKMVLRYAQSEKAVIDAKKEAATADKRVKEAVKEKDILLSKVNHLVQERNRMSQQMEAKVSCVIWLFSDFVDSLAASCNAISFKAIFLNMLLCHENTVLVITIL